MLIAHLLAQVFRGVNQFGQSRQGRRVMGHETSRGAANPGQQSHNSPHRHTWRSSVQRVDSGEHTLPIPATGVPPPQTRLPMWP